MPGFKVSYWLVIMMIGDSMVGVMKWSFWFFICFLILFYYFMDGGRLFGWISMPIYNTLPVAIARFICGFPLHYGYFMLWGYTRGVILHDVGAQHD